MDASGSKKEKLSTINLLWFDENIYNEENQSSFNKLNSVFKNSKRFESLEEGFEYFYENKKEKFQIIIVIISGKLFGRYVQKIKDNINKIINIPYTYIFTSTKFKNILLNKVFDQTVSYDTKVSVNSCFYNPGGVQDDFNDLLSNIKKVVNTIDYMINIGPKHNEKLNYEGILTFEYLENEEDLLAPALYKDIIVNEEITESDIENFHSFILSFNDKGLNNLIKSLYIFKYIPFEILSKYWARCYTVESLFYRELNNNLMKSKLTPNSKTFIKMLYTGIEINSLKSYHGKLFRGSTLNKVELEKIDYYKKIGKLSNIVAFAKAFLSFSEDQESALKFCGKTDKTKVGCLYILESNSINLHESNADIQNISVFPNEKEILFFPGSSFIIKKINKINDNIIGIILDYNGKFREKYKFLYDDQIKLNKLIYGNIMTKNIAGKQLEFLKGGKYLKGENIDEFNTTFKGKNLETDEIVSIRQIRKDYYFDQIFEYGIINALKLISANVTNSVKYIEHFETNSYLYIIQNTYDDNLENYIKIHKRLTPNLIHKILKQINYTIKGFLENHTFIIVRPSNILIRYCNREKTNFDSFLSDYWIISQKYLQMKEQMKNSQPNFSGFAQMTPCNLFVGPKFFSFYDYYLYSIGITIYILYFGTLPFSSYSPVEYNRLLYQPKNIEVTIVEDKLLEDLINKILRANINERISWFNYFNHPFFKQYIY